MKTIGFACGRMVAIVVWHMLIFPGLKISLGVTSVGLLWCSLCCLYERFAWRQQDFISDPNAASLHHRPSLPRSAEDTWYDETIWNHCVCFWEDGCNRCLTYVSFPGLKSALVSHLWGLLWFSLSVACMKRLLEGSRISFQTLMQHHFVTDHHCRGYVIWWNHMKPLGLFLGGWLQSLLGPFRGGGSSHQSWSKTSKGSKMKFSMS